MNKARRGKGGRFWPILGFFPHCGLSEGSFKPVSIVLQFCSMFANISKVSWNMFAITCTALAPIIACLAIYFLLWTNQG